MSTKMSEQQSQKRGVVSEAQKTTTARNGYKSIPPAHPVGGAQGKRVKNRQSDGELALSKAEKAKTKAER